MINKINFIHKKSFNFYLTDCNNGFYPERGLLLENSAEFFREIGLYPDDYSDFCTIDKRLCR